MEAVTNDPSPSLLQGCRQGDDASWRQLFAVYQESVRRRIAWLLRDHGRDRNVVDEIAAQVWYRLVVGRLLGLYDPRRACFRAFLFGYIRQEVRRRYRPRRSRPIRVIPLGGLDLADPAGDVCPLGLMLNELLSALSPRLREFTLQQVGGPAQASGRPAPSPANARQMEVRIRRHVRGRPDGRVAGTF
jgi:DNA-directed RNA polymerase specialized sigma24 family protein